MEEWKKNDCEGGIYSESFLRMSNSVWSIKNGAKVNTRNSMK